MYKCARVCVCVLCVCVLVVSMGVCVCTRGDYERVGVYVSSRRVCVCVSPRGVVDRQSDRGGRGFCGISLLCVHVHVHVHVCAAVRWREADAKSDNVRACYYPTQPQGEKAIAKKYRAQKKVHHRLAKKN